MRFYLIYQEWINPLIILLHTRRGGVIMFGLWWANEKKHRHFPERANEQLAGAWALFRYEGFPKMVGFPNNHGYSY